MPTLHVVHKDGRTVDVEMTKDRISIGRSKDNAIMLDDSTASRNHAEIIRTREGFQMKDLGSFNGTKLNDKSEQRALLKHNDLIEIGLTKITFLSAAPDVKSPTAGSVLLTP